MAEPLENFHFLIAGTDAAHLETMDEMLFAAGAEKVTRAASGREAVASWRSATRIVDCVISECKMAEGNGLQLLYALRTGRILSVRPDTCFIPFADSADPKIISVCAQLDVKRLPGGTRQQGAPARDHCQGPQAHHQDQL